MMSLSLLLIGMCGLVMVVLLIGGIVMVMRAGQRDSVSAAREDWLSHSNDDNETGQE